MRHPIYRVRSFDIVSAFALRVRFDDNTEQTIDFRPILAGELYSPLRDLELFNQVRIDVVGLRINIYKYRLRAGLRYSFSSSNKGMRRCDHLIAMADAKRP